MRRAVADADRRATVRRAARNWCRSGLIDKSARAAFERAFPDDRRRFGPALRSLAFIFTVLTSTAAFAFLLQVVRFTTEIDVAGFFALLLGLLLLLLTEALKGPLRLADVGIESASGLLACGFLLGATVWLAGKVLSDGHGVSDEICYLSGIILFGGAALRWGSTVGATIATCLVGSYLARLPAARLSWVIATLLLAPLAHIGSESKALAPAHRRASAAVLFMSLVGLYIALHIGSWDARLFEGGPRSGQVVDAGYAGAPRELFILSTAIVPLVILAYGIATRRRLLTGLGALQGAASLVTWHVYMDIAPLWAILTVAGAVLVLVALGLRRWLASGAGSERGGYTAQLLSVEEGKTTLVLETAATVAAATPRAHEAPATTPRFEGGGGRSGGGGSTADY